MKKGKKEEEHKTEFSYNQKFPGSFDDSYCEYTHHYRLNAGSSTILHTPFM